MAFKDFFVRTSSAKLPPQLHALLDATDKPLGAVPVSPSGERWAVASKAALLLVSQDGVEWRASWDAVERGSWDGDERTFTLHWLNAELAMTRLEVPLTVAGRDVDPSLFARVLRQRVESAIVHRASAVLPSGKNAHVSVRRGEDGELYSISSIYTGAGLNQRVALSELPQADLAALRALEAHTRDGVGLDTSGV